MKTIQHRGLLFVTGGVLAALIGQAAGNAAPAAGAAGPAAPASPAASLAGCPIFPADNVWNTRVDWLPLDPRSDDYIDSIGPNTGLHPDFGAGEWDGGPIGIPYTTVIGSQPPVDIDFTAYGNQSDPGPYPIPEDAPIEGGPDSDGDRHVLVVDTDDCVLYELYDSWPHEDDDGWDVASGAVFDLNSHALRPDTWTSADASGLSILSGLARYDEVAAGEIRHALRFTASNTQKKHVWPARHHASDITDLNVPPMGQRFRLKASFDISGYSPQTQVILRALKIYGMILTDNGSNWYISGAPDPGWDDESLVDELKTVKGSNFEAVDESILMIQANSGQARQPISVFVPLAVR